MANNYFRFKKFTIYQDKCVFKAGTDGVLLGALADIAGDGWLLDIGTGTGLIAIMAAQRTNCRIAAIEPDNASFLQACENVKACPWNDRIMVENCSFREYYLNSPGKFDFIVTNPPYFRNSLKNPDKVKSMARHADSLTSDDLIEGTTHLLHENGSLHLILPYSEGAVFIAVAAEKGLYCNRIIKVRAVPSGPIIRLIMKFEKSKKQLREKFITIETGKRHVYTPEYIEATKDFYLNF
ncbi:MAG: tRNA1(Val) (adenine(37)-N6)-methyltransferase [Bacteroidales bacterium]